MADVLLPLLQLLSLSSHHIAHTHRHTDTHTYTHTHHVCLLSTNHASRAQTSVRLPLASARGGHFSSNLIFTFFLRIPEIVKSFRYWSFPCSFCDRSGWTAFDELLQNGDQAISNDTEYDKNNFIVTEATMEAAMLHPLGDVLNHNEEIDDSDEETNLVV